MIAASDTKRKHAKYVLTPWLAQGTNALPPLVRAEGVYLYDEDGKRYLDLCSGLIAVNLGHGHPRVVAAIAEQAARLCYSPPNYPNDVRAELAEALIGLAPWNEGGRVFFTTNGASANEDAIKLIRTVSGRPKILSGYRSFHGSSPGAGTLTGENRRWPNEPGLPSVVRFWTPFPYRSPFFTTDPAIETERALAHLRDVLEAENPAAVAAILLEPVIGSNGVIVFPPGYLAGVRRLCDAHGIALIFDEVMTGFGRVGAAFAGERFGVVPDAITFAKGVTSAYVPLGGVMLREGLAAHFDERPLPCGHTYSGHPLAMAAGVATLQAYAEGRLFERGRELEAALRGRLEAVAGKHSIVGEVRGAGAFFAVEFVRDRSTREPLVAWQGSDAGRMAPLFGALRKAGVAAFGRYNVLHVAPPLTVSDGELDEAAHALDAAIGELARAVG